MMSLQVSESGNTTLATDKIKTLWYICTIQKSYVAIYIPQYKLLTCSIQETNGFRVHTCKY